MHRQVFRVPLDWTVEKKKAVAWQEMKQMFFPEQGQAAKSLHKSIIVQQLNGIKITDHFQEAVGQDRSDVCFCRVGVGVAPYSMCVRARPCAPVYVCVPVPVCPCVSWD